MWVALVPSGMDWLDAEIGGVPAAGVVAALGQAGSGKTSLALGFAMAQLRRHGRVCYLTSETPEAVLEAARGMLELDLRQYIANGTLTLLSFAPFFVNKVRSLSSVDQPLAELKELFEERRIEHVVFDTLDPMLGWIDAAHAKASVRHMLGQIQSWGRAVFCTMGSTAPAAFELARLVSGSFELTEGKIIVRQAGWCNVYDIEAPLHFVQGRGLVVRANAGRQPAKKSLAQSDNSLIAAAGMIPDSSPRPDVDRRNDAGPPSMTSGGHVPWTSLIGDANKILGPQAVIVASEELFTPQARQAPAPQPSVAPHTHDPSTPRMGASAPPPPVANPSRPPAGFAPAAHGPFQTPPSLMGRADQIHGHSPRDPRDEGHTMVEGRSDPGRLNPQLLATAPYNPDLRQTLRRDPVEEQPPSSRTLITPPRDDDDETHALGHDAPTNIFPPVMDPANKPRPAAGSPVTPPRPSGGPRRR